MSTVEMKQLVRVMEQTLRVKSSDINLETRRGDLPEWDSLGHIMLVEAISKEFKIKISGDQALQMETVADILRVLQTPAK